MKSRRHVRRPPDLTSLFDVLFIVVFAALIRAAAVQHAAEAAAPRPSPPPAPRTSPRAPPSALHQRALAALADELAARTPVVVRIDARGVAHTLEVGGRRIAVGVPLLEQSPLTDVALAYRGDRAADLRICRIAAHHLRASDLGGYLVIVAPEVALDDLPHALYDGLHRDVARCRDERGQAALIDATTPPSPTSPPRQP